MRALILAGLLTLASACGEPPATVALGPGDAGLPSGTATATAEPGTGSPEPTPAPAASSEVVPHASPVEPAPATTATTPSPESSPTGPRELGEDEDAKIGQPYRYRLYTHCGVRTTWWNGAWWNAAPPQDTGHGSPPAQWNDPYQDGVMVQVSETRLEFTGDEGQRADFVPRPASEGAPPPCA